MENGLRWVPVAFFLMDRVASTSLLIWLSQLDGRPRRKGREHFAFVSLAEERLKVRNMSQSMAS